MPKKTDMVPAVIPASDVPAYLQKLDTPVRLDDNFDSTDVTIPRVGLLQGQSQVVKDIAEAQPGVFWHFGFDMKLDPLRFIVVYRRKRALLVAPMPDGRGVLARAEDAKTWDRLGDWPNIVIDRKTKTTAHWKITDRDVARSGLLNWGTSNPSMDDSPPAATLFYDYVVLLPDHLDLGPAVISLARSALRKAKKGLNDKILLYARSGKPVHSVIYEATVTEESGPEGAFYNWQFGSVGYANEALFNIAGEAADAMRDTSFAVQDEMGHGDTVTQNNDADLPY